MPSADMIIWAGISGLIVVMLGVIGWLVKSGFKGLREELKAMWDKLEANRAKEENNARMIAEINVRCSERHTERSGQDRRTRFDD